MYEELTDVGTKGSRVTAARAARPRRYLMCPPTFFDVTYSINPWMEPNKPIDANLAMAQWERLHELYMELGHEVEFIEPIEGLPDMVFRRGTTNATRARQGLGQVAHDRPHEPPDGLRTGPPTLAIDTFRHALSAVDWSARCL